MANAKVDPRNIAAFSTAPQEIAVEDSDRVLIDRAGTIKYATVADFSSDFPAAPTFAVDQTIETSDGATTTFNLGISADSKDAVLVFVDGVATRDFTLADDGNSITLDFTPSENQEVSIVVLGISTAALVNARGSIQFLETDTDTEIDLTNESNWTNWAAGTGWSRDGTVTFTGTIPTGLGFTFTNNSGHIIYLTDTDNAGETLDIGTLPMPLLDQHTISFVRNPTNGLMYGFNRGWRGGSGYPPGVYSGGPMAGSNLVNVRLGETVTGYLTANAKITQLQNSREGRPYQFVIDLQGFTLEMPTNTLRGNPDSSTADIGGSDGYTGVVWFELMKLSEDTTGDVYYLHVKETELG